MGQLFGRRSLLCSVVAVGLAGCLSSSSSSGGAIEDTDFDGGDLVVRLNEEEPVSEIQVFGPEEEVFFDESVDASAQHTVSFAGSYTPGEYEIVARSEEGDDLGTTILELEPDLRIVGAGTPRQYDDYSPGFRRGLRPESSIPVFEVENSGTGPDTIERIILDRSPPGDEHAQEGRAEEDLDGNTVIGPGETGLVARLPALWLARADCDEAYDGAVTLETAVSGEISAEYEVVAEMTDDSDPSNNFFTESCEKTWNFE